MTEYDFYDALYCILSFPSMRGHTMFFVKILDQLHENRLFRYCAKNVFVLVNLDPFTLTVVISLGSCVLMIR